MMPKSCVCRVAGNESSTCCTKGKIFFFFKASSSFLNKKQGQDLRVTVIGAV